MSALTSVGWSLTQSALLHLRRLNYLRVTDGLACLSALYCLFRLARLFQTKDDGLPLPPCPPKQGPLGHAGIFPKSFEYFAYEKWAKELDTDIIHLQLGKKILVVLSSWEAISNILESQSHLYSDHYQDTMKSKVVGWEWLLSSLPYGERWRKARALFHQHMHPSNVELYQPTQLAFIRGLLLPQLLEGPTSSINPIVKHFTGGLSISTAYGIEIQPKDDPYVRLSENALSGLIQSSKQGGWLVDFYPILRFVPAWFPGAAWKRQALVWRQWQNDMRTKAFDATMGAISNGTAKPSFVLECIQAMGDASDHDHLELIKDCSGIVFAGGADTTASAINTFLLAMLCYPDAQEKAREELDRVVGRGRLPTFDDKENLPYITAIMKEGFRWQSPNPVGLPHMSSQEGMYKGYRIPKGALVFGNVWSLMHDENDFPNSMEFKPERYLNPDGTLNTEIQDPSSVVFGFGRSIRAAAFEIKPGIDDDGLPIPPEPQYLTGFARLAAPFRATFKVRSKEVSDMIRAGEGYNL